MKKKILSIILAISMIVSLVPVISASAEGETPYQLVYDFRNIDGYSGGVIEDLNDITYAKTEGTWAFDSSSGDNVEHKVNYGIEIKSNNVGDYFAVKINVPYDGDYVPTLKYMELNTGAEETYAKADVYILPEGSDIGTAEDADKKIIAEDLYFNKNGGKNTGSSKYDELAEYTPGSTIRLSAGENILVFYLTETTTYSDYARMRPGALTLTSGTLAEGASYATVPMYISEAKANDAELETGDSTTLEISGWMNDGTEFDEAYDTVLFVSKNGKLRITGNTATAIGEGADIITATVTSGGKSISKDIAVTVLPASPAYELVYDFKNIDSTYVGDLTSSKLTPELGFNHTEGTWAFHSWNGLDGDTVTYKPNYGVEIKSDGVGDYFAVKINVPYEGDYIPSLTYYELDTKDDAKYVAADVYVLPKDSDVSTASESDKTVIAKDLYFCKNGGKNTDMDLGEYVSETPVTLSAGEHILVFYVTRCNGTLSAGNTRLRPGVLTLTSGTPETGEDYATVPMYISEAKANDAELETGDSTTLEISGWMNDGTAFDKNSNTVSFDTESENISIDGNTVTASSAGTATVTASVTSGEKTLAKDIDIAVVPTAQEMVEAAFNAAETTTQYNAPDLTGLTIGGKVINGVPNGDGSFNITAPAAKENGSKFLYWAKALTTKKTILLYKTNELKNYIPGENGRELLIAVYEDELPTSAEYYNANGQLLPDATAETTAYMAGYGTTNVWEQYGDTNIYVAKFSKTQPDPVIVTVENGTGGGTVPYGEPVTCTADDTNGTFQWWQKDVNGKQEIVSVDKEYSFLAYENCTVTAVYGDTAVNVTNPAKIIIDTFGENSIMAEFIGFKNKTVLEKGIMFGENRIAMTAPGNQFTVTADKNGTFKGYAIVENEENYTLITDGEATISGLSE